MSYKKALTNTIEFIIGSTLLLGVVIGLVYLVTFLMSLIDALPPLVSIGVMLTILILMVYALLASAFPDDDKNKH